MKTDCLTHVEAALSSLDLDALARQSRFCRREPRKLPPRSFLLSCCLLLAEPLVSLRRWALLIGTLTNQTYAKQSLCERLSDRAVRFVQGVVLSLVSRLNTQEQPALPAALTAFARVLIQDSTILTLPAKLRSWFPGARNQNGHLGGMIRLQGLYDLRHRCFVHFSHSAFTRNDQTLAHEVLAHLSPGDLLLRDLGYLVLAVLRQIGRRGAFYLSRFKVSLVVLEPEGQRLDLVRRLKKRTAPLDEVVHLGAREQLPARLVGFRVSDQEANRRRRVARRNHHFHASPKHLALLDWDLFITNASALQLSAREVAKVYGLRFHIETIFKSWKSHFQLEDLPAGSRAQVETLLYARLLLITILEVRFWARWEDQLQDRAGPLSRLKVAAFLRLYLPITLLPELQPDLEAALQKQLPYHCTYEKRRKRKNFAERLKLT
jgi:hypothetical protein